MIKYFDKYAIEEKKIPLTDCVEQGHFQRERLL